MSQTNILPVLAAKDDILKMYSQYNTLIVIGDTGSGKTTQIPQFIYEYEKNKRSNKSQDHKYSSGRLCVTQPRRVAAMSLAKRVAQEMNVKLGGIVGYSVRFDEVTSKETMIKYLTDGMLLRELLSDQKLTKYSTIILDEAHERTLRTDILFGMIKIIQATRPINQPLKIIIMSATLDPARFQSFFMNVGVYRVPGRMYPVKLLYTTEPVQDYIDAAILTIFQLHTDIKNSNGGDILVFLTGQEEIEAIQRTLEEFGPECPAGTPRMIVCPIFASLPSHQQMAVFQSTPSGCRKIILATNIAETSITISGIRFVIDPGFVKMRQYNSRTGMEALLVQPISKSSARQRTGRAGREASGDCYRLYPEEAFLKLEDETVPEILRTNLSNVILIMKACGVENVLKFDYLDPPGLDCLQRGLEELLALGALDIEGGLTSTGKSMAECPLIPQLSRVLLEAGKLGCLEEALTVISMLSSDTIFFSNGEDREKTSAAKKTFQHRSGDHLTLLNVYNTFLAHRNDPKWCSSNYIDPRSMKHVCDVRQQLVDFCGKTGLKVTSCNGAVEKVLQAFVAGYFLQAAIRLADGTYKSIAGKQHVHIHPSSVIFGNRPDCIIFHEITLTSKCYLRGVSSVESAWISEQTVKAQSKPLKESKGHTLSINMHFWEIKNDFVVNANRLREILNTNDQNQRTPGSKLSEEEIMEEARNDKYFAFVLHLLAEETKCRGYSLEKWNIPKLSDKFLTLGSWFDQLLAGLVCEPFPTVQYLLKQQNKPSVYAELDHMFAATILLNYLAEIYDPNLEHITDNYSKNIIINPEQYSIYRNLPESVKARIDSIFQINIPKGIEAFFSNGPSFKFEILNYIDFESRSDFKTIPIQFLDLDDGSDFGIPFGKRWARRLVAKSVAYDKIHFDILKKGKFPVPLSKSLEGFNMNFNVQLPEMIGIDLLHQNVFDISFLTPEFLDYSAFAMHFAKFLVEIPEFLSHKLKNTDIFAHAPISNTNKSGAKASLASFRALLLAAGIRGHLTLNVLLPVDIHEILNFDSEETSACLLLGLALSALKTKKLKNDQSKFLLRLFSLHLPSFQTSLGLEIPPILQLSAAFSLGIFKFRSFDRGISQLLLKEIFRPLPMNVNFKSKEDSPLFSIIPAITLGMCLMGAASTKTFPTATALSSEIEDISNHQQFAADIQKQLNSFSFLNSGSNINIQHQISVLISTAFINIGNSEFDQTTLPWARSLPDLLDKSEGVVFWCHLNWRLCKWDQPFIENLNDQGCDRIKLNFETIFDSVCQPAPDSVWTDSSELGVFIYACQCLTANSFFLALRFSGELGSKNLKKNSIDLLDVWIQKIRSFSILHNTDKDYFLTKIQMHLLTTYQYILLCRCILFSGSGEVTCWGLLREFMADPLLFKYGNSRLFYSSIGFLFSGKGQLSVCTQEKDGSINFLAVASLLCYLIPILPTSPSDSEFSFITLFDSLWPLFMRSI